MAAPTRLGVVDTRCKAHAQAVRVIVHGVPWLSIYVSDHIHLPMMLLMERDLQDLRNSSPIRASACVASQTCVIKTAYRNEPGVSTHRRLRCYLGSHRLTTRSLRRNHYTYKRQTEDTGLHPNACLPRSSACLSQIEVAHVNRQVLSPKLKAVSTEDGQGDV